MELIYALLIFFGAMTPNEYSSQTNSAFNQETLNYTVQSNQSLFDEIASISDAGDRIRAIDRTED